MTHLTKKNGRDTSHFDIFIIKIFTYKIAYKHYLQRSEHEKYLYSVQPATQEETNFFK